MADAAVKQFGRIDILVNNAALRREKPFAADETMLAWREILDVTLDGTFHCVKACLPALRQSRDGDHRQYRRPQRPHWRRKIAPMW